SVPLCLVRALRLRDALLGAGIEEHQLRQVEMELAALSGLERKIRPEAGGEFAPADQQHGEGIGSGGLDDLHARLDGAAVAVEAASPKADRFGAHAGDD